MAQSKGEWREEGPRDLRENPEIRGARHYAVSARIHRLIFGMVAKTPRRGV